MSGCLFIRHGYDHFSTGVSSFKKADNLSNLTSWVTSFDDGYDFASLKYRHYSPIKNPLKWVA